jgi:hypothetical protein
MASMERQPKGYQHAPNAYNKSYQNVQDKMLDHTEVLFSPQNAQTIYKTHLYISIGRLRSVPSDEARTSILFLSLRLLSFLRFNCPISARHPGTALVKALAISTSLSRPLVGQIPKTRSL